MSKAASSTETNPFTNAYAALNNTQKQAVDTIEGPVLVVAGPGTGKTQILALRVCNVIRSTDTPPDGILALTFTEAGATAMRERLVQYLGADAYRIGIYTFHGFAGMLLREYPEAFPRIIGGTLATDLERIAYIESALAQDGIKKLRPVGNPAYYINPVLHEITTLKQEDIDPDGFAKLIGEQEAALSDEPRYHEKGAHKGKERSAYTKQAAAIEKNRELLLVYRAYEATLAAEGRYDYTDLIRFAVTAMQENEAMLHDLQERFLYVLADEHQDVNGAQSHILEQLVSFHDSPNIFVVGDEKQAIYRFQGASLENFLHFQHQFTGTKVISLTENYRSTQAILDAAHALIAVPDGELAKLRQPLSGTEAGTPPTIHTFPHQGVEDFWLAQEIKQLCDSGTPAREIAVIVRTNAQVEALTSYLRGQGIAVHPSADSDILQHPIMHAVRALLQVVISPNDNAALGQVLLGPAVAAPLSDVAAVLQKRSHERPLIATLKDEETLRACGVADPQPFLDFHRLVERVQTEQLHTAPHELLATLLTESGYLERLEEQAPLESGRVIRRLYDEVEQLVRNQGIHTLAALAETFTLREAHHVPLNAPYLDTNLDAVQVLTAHKSKGREFDHVFMPRAADSTWGGRRNAKAFTIPLTTMVDQSQFDQIDDERRLFYVAMTRARKTLSFSTSELDSDGRSRIPTRFLGEPVDEHCTHTDHPEPPTAFNPTHVLATKPSETVTQELLLDLFAARGFSATSINNYLDNPWHYVFRNLLRLPEIQNTSMQFGTVIHNVLDWAVRQGKQKELPSIEAAIDRLEYELRAQPLSAKDYSSLHEKGLTVLTSYLPHLEANQAPAATSEKSLNVLFETGVPELPTIPLSGKLDRLDFNQNGSLVRVIDYKTGKPRSRNQIEGNTKNSDKSYKRQLEFYALLLQLHAHEELQTHTYTLSFVEPTTKGDIKEETFTIRPEDTEELQQHIREAVVAVVSGTWLADPTLIDTSEYPALARYVWEEWR